jgi:hypothetical protein
MLLVAMEAQFLPAPAGDRMGISPLSGLQEQHADESSHHHSQICNRSFDPVKYF